MRASGPPVPGGRFVAAFFFALAAAALLAPAAAQSETDGPSPPPANDAFASAESLDGGFGCEGPFCWASVGGSTLDATLEAAEPQDCPLGATVWYWFDLAEAADVDLTLTSDFTAVLAAYASAGDGLASLETLGCAEASAPSIEGAPSVDLSFLADVGPVWIQVGGVQGEGTEAGSFTLSVTLEALPVFDVTPDETVLRVNEKGAFAIEVDNLVVDGIAWDFDDGTQAEGSDVVHRWTAAGDYAVVATGQTANGSVEGGLEPTGPWDVAQVTVVPATLQSVFTVQNAFLWEGDFGGELVLVRGDLEFEVLPPALLADPIRVAAGSPLLFTEEAFGGSGALEFNWTFGDGEWATGETATHSYDTIGSYAAKLTVTDGTGRTHALARTIHVFEQLPFSGHVDPGSSVAMEVPGYVTIVCEVGVDGVAADFDGYVVLATHPDGLGDGVGAFRDRGALFLSIEGGPEAGQCDKVTITLLYSDGQLAAARASESRLRVFYWTDEDWRSLRVGTIAGATPDRDLQVFSVSIDPAGNQAVFVTDHTSSFAIGSPLPSGGGGSAPATSAPDAPATDAGVDAPSDAGPTDSGADAGAGAAAGAAGPGAGASSPAGTPTLLVRRPDGTLVTALPGTTLDGEVVLVARNAPDGSLFILVAEAGERTELGPGTGAAGWDTESSGNGRYTVELHGFDGTVLTSSSYLVYNGRAEPLDVAGAALLGAGIMGAGFLLSALLNVVREGATAVGEDKFRERTKRHALTAWLARVPSLPSLLIGVPAFVVFFTLDGMETLDWRAYLERLPTVAIAATLVFGAAYSLEILLNVASGARSRFQLLLTGFLALASSTLLFRTAFGYPGFVEEDEVEGGLPAHVEGLRSIALLLVILFLAAPFLLVMAFWSFSLGETGMAIVMSLLATSSLPFRPVPGANIWRWNKAVSLLVVAAGFGLFVAFELGLVPLVAIAVAGLVGLGGFAGIYLWLRQRPRPADAMPDVAQTVTDETPATA